MSSARALANQKLYHAKILTAAWREALEREQVAKSVLEQAFGPAVCRHLAGAYGWFLVEVAQPADMPDHPPACCADLPPAIEGRETPPEIMEFQRLEQEAWLTHILQAENGPEDVTAEKTNNLASQNLALASEHVFGPVEAERWHSQLSQLFERMSDSLEEY